MGEFEEDGRSLVLYLDAAIATRRMTRPWLQDVIELNPDEKQETRGGRSITTATVRAQYLPHCWIPRRLFDRWLTMHRLEQSPPRFQPRCVEHARTNVSWEAAPRGAKTRGIREAIKQLWPREIPKGLSAKERNNAIREQLEKNGGSIPEDLPRAVQRALKKAPPPK